MMNDLSVTEATGPQGFDIQYFDFVDFDLLDDDGNFEQFCQSMDFDPVADNPSDSSDVGSDISDPKSDPASPMEDLKIIPKIIAPAVKEPKLKKKRKLGAPKAPNNITPICVPPPPLPPPPAPDLSSQTTTQSITDDDDMSALTSASKKSKKGQDVTGDDIRRKYPTIFSEAFNNFDKLEFGEILKLYCEDDLLAIYEFVGHNPFGSPKYIEVRGRETVVAFWDSLFTTIPDSVFNVHSTKYKVLPNDYTSITCAFSFRGTKVYNMSGVENNPSKNVVISQDNCKLIASVVPGENCPEIDENCNASTRDSISSQDFNVVRSKMISTFVTIIGTLTFYVNSNRKIYRISFVHSVKM